MSPDTEDGQRYILQISALHWNLFHWQPLLSHTIEKLIKLSASEPGINDVIEYSIIHVIVVQNLHIEYCFPVIQIEGRFSLRKGVSPKEPPCNKARKFSKSLGDGRASARGLFFSQYSPDRNNCGPPAKMWCDLRVQKWNDGASNCFARTALER